MATEPHSVAPPPHAPRTRTLAPWIAGCASAALLLLANALFGVEHVSVEETVGYHERVASLKDRIPYSVEAWVGGDVEVPPSAIEILHPNVLLNRRFENMQTGEMASLLFVQCSDARDLRGHYPPRCYPGQGWILGSATEHEWDVKGTTIHGMRYVFNRSSATSEAQIVVDNFMALPSGEFGRDMEAVARVAKDRRLRLFGAAQLQVVTSAGIDDDRRDAIFHTLVEPTLPILNALTTEAHRE